MEVTRKEIKHILSNWRFNFSFSREKKKNRCLGFEHSPLDQPTKPLCSSSSRAFSPIETEWQNPVLDSTKQNKTDLKFSKAHAVEIGKENVKGVGRQFFKVSCISVYLVKKLCGFCSGRIFVYKTTLEDMSVYCQG